MALIGSDLAGALNAIDASKAPPDPMSATLKWFSAWWTYFSKCSQLNPSVLVTSKALAQTAFVPTMLPAMVPNPVPAIFLAALETSIRASIAAVSNPAMLLPPLLSITPAPSPLAPTLLSVIPLGLASRNKSIPRRQMAILIDAWTRLHIAVGPTGPVGPLG